MAARWRGGFLHALLAGGAVAYTTHPTAARISAFVDTIDKAGPKLPQMEQMKETECPRCGSAKGGAANCCSGDGAWAGKCSMVAGEMEHTWAEGFAACIGAATQQQQAVLNASNQGLPVIIEDESDAAQAYIDVIKRFVGEEQPHRFIQIEKRGFFSRLFSGTPRDAYAGG